MTDKLFSVEGKICIVTGGLGQIGKNFVEELHNRGAKVAVFSRTVNQPRIESIFPKDQFNHDNLAFYAVDINQKETIEVALDAIEAAFPDFLRNVMPNDPMKCEFLLPTTVGQMLNAGTCSVKVLTSPDNWYGVTYAEDKPKVVAALKALTDSGRYPDGLWD